MLHQPEICESQAAQGYTNSAKISKAICKLPAEHCTAWAATTPFVSET